MQVRDWHSSLKGFGILALSHLAPYPGVPSSSAPSSSSACLISRVSAPMTSSVSATALVCHSASSACWSPQASVSTAPFRRSSSIRRSARGSIASLPCEVAAASTGSGVSRNLHPPRKEIQCRFHDGTIHRSRPSTQPVLLKADTTNRPPCFPTFVTPFEDCADRRCLPPALRQPSVWDSAYSALPSPSS